MRHITFLLIIIPIVTLSACGKKVITSSNGDLSPGSFAYLKFLNNNKEKDDNKIIIQNLITKDVYGTLAEKFNLKDDANYKKYILIYKRTRTTKGGAAYLKRELGKYFKIEDAYYKYKVDVNINDVASLIYSKIKRVGNRAILKDKNIILGKWIGGDIKLNMLEEQMLPSEKQLLVSLAEKAMRLSLDENLRIWFFSELNKVLLKELNVVNSEIERFDHNEVAELFLNKKYGLAVDGIYPTSVIKINLTSKEILNYFHRIKYRFMDVKWARVKIVIVNNREKAESFIKELSNGQTFESLSERYSSSNKTLKLSKSHIIYGYNENFPLKSREKTPVIKKLVLDFAEKNILKPVTYRLQNHFVIFWISHIEWNKKKLDFSDSRGIVKQELTLDLLRRQFPIDLSDTKKKLNFKINFSLIKK